MGITVLQHTSEHITSPPRLPVGHHCPTTHIRTHHISTQAPSWASLSYNTHQNTSHLHPGSQLGITVLQHTLEHITSPPRLPVGHHCPTTHIRTHHISTQAPSWASLSYNTHQNTSHLHPGSQLGITVLQHTSEHITSPPRLPVGHHCPTTHIRTHHISTQAPSWASLSYNTHQNTSHLHPGSQLGITVLQHTSEHITSPPRLPVGHHCPTTHIRTHHISTQTTSWASLSYNTHQNTSHLHPGSQLGITVLQHTSEYITSPPRLPVGHHCPTTHIRTHHISTQAPSWASLSYNTHQNTSHLHPGSQLGITVLQHTSEHITSPPRLPVGHHCPTTHIRTHHISTQTTSWASLSYNTHQNTSHLHPGSQLGITVLQHTSEHITSPPRLPVGHHCPTTHIRTHHISTQTTSWASLSYNTHQNTSHLHPGSQLGITVLQHTSEHITSLPRLPVGHHCPTTHIRTHHISTQAPSWASLSYNTHQNTSHLHPGSQLGITVLQHTSEHITSLPRLPVGHHCPTTHIRTHHISTQAPSWASLSYNTHQNTSHLHPGSQLGITVLQHTSEHITSPPRLPVGHHCPTTHIRTHHISTQAPSWASLSYNTHQNTSHLHPGSQLGITVLQHTSEHITSPPRLPVGHHCPTTHIRIHHISTQAPSWASLSYNTHQNTSHLHPGSQLGITVLQHTSEHITSPPRLPVGHHCPTTHIRTHHISTQAPSWASLSYNTHQNTSHLHPGSQLGITVLQHTSEHITSPPRLPVGHHCPTTHIRTHHISTQAPSWASLSYNTHQNTSHLHPGSQLGITVLQHTSEHITSLPRLPVGHHCSTTHIRIHHISTQAPSWASLSYNTHQNTSHLYPDYQLGITVLQHTLEYITSLPRLPVGHHCPTTHIRIHHISTQTTSWASLSYNTH